MVYNLPFGDSHLLLNIDLSQIQAEGYLISAKMPRRGRAVGRSPAGALLNDEMKKVWVRAVD